MSPDTDIHMMRYAIAMARRGVGRVRHGRPSVGCVLVRDGVVIAAARTYDSGAPHAEAAALAMVDQSAQGATAYVTLEPCAHHGKTPPCAEALVRAGVARVVIACRDPNPKVNGRGIDILKAAGIDVTVGVCADQAGETLQGFFTVMTQNRPSVTLKTACTLDGKTALASGESRWITGAAARRHVQSLRARHDAIMVGAGTAMADNPMLTARVSGLNHVMTRIVLDSFLHLPLSSQLVKTAREHPLIIFCTADAPTEKAQALSSLGASVIRINPRNITAVLEKLAAMGVQNLLVEGGATLHTSFLTAGVCDALVIYRAPTLLGDDARGGIDDLNLPNLRARYDFECVLHHPVGVDMVEIYKPKRQISCSQA